MTDQERTRFVFDVFCRLSDEEHAIRNLHALVVLAFLGWILGQQMSIDVSGRLFLSLIYVLFGTIVAVTRVDRLRKCDAVAGDFKIQCDVSQLPVSVREAVLPPNPISTRTVVVHHLLMISVVLGAIWSRSYEASVTKIDTIRQQAPAAAEAPAAVP